MSTQNQEKITVPMSSWVWQSEALEVLNPLRFHLDELIEAIESHNRYARAVGQPQLSEKKIAAAKAAAESANTFLSGKKQSE